MKIECLIKRPGGTKVRLGATPYHFKPDELDRHVAKVENEDHQKAFLSVKEGYVSLDPLPIRPVSLDEAIAALRAQFPDADPAQLAEVISARPEPAQEAPQGVTVPAPEQGFTATTPNADEAGEAADDAEGDDAEGDDDLADLSDDDLRVEFEKWLGRKPHHNMLRENMIAQISAAKSPE